LAGRFGWRYGRRAFFAPLQNKAVQVVARTRKDRLFYRRADPASMGSRAARGFWRGLSRPSGQPLGRRDEAARFSEAGLAVSSCSCGADWACAARQVCRSRGSGFADSCRKPEAASGHW